MTNKDNKFAQIDKMFAELQAANDETVDSIRSKLSDDNNLASLKRSRAYEESSSYKRALVIKRPSIPMIPTNLKTRLDIFLYCLKNVDYGSSNNRSYVDGHLEALDSYLEKAQMNSNNLEVVSGILVDEIKRLGNTSKSDLREKGYYDGLNYVNQALKKSKDIMAKNINDILQRELLG